MLRPEPIERIQGLVHHSPKYLPGQRYYKCLGNLLQCLTNVPVKKNILIPNQNFSCSVLCPLPLMLSLCTSKKMINHLVHVYKSAFYLHNICFSFSHAIEEFLFKLIMCSAIWSHPLVYIHYEGSEWTYLKVSVVWKLLLFSVLGLFQSSWAVKSVFLSQFLWN